MRHLVTIQKVKNLLPIAGKDRIVLCEMESVAWQTIVQKDLYQIGDLICFAEIDTVLPIELFPELESRKGRIKTFTANSDNGKVLSQGYCFPFQRFKEILDESDFWDEMETIGFEGSVIQWYEGNDITKLIGAYKYEAPIQGDSKLSGGSVGNFPSHIIPKTDETRVESVPRVLEEMKDKSYFITEKQDGTSSTFGWFENEFYVCSRSQRKKVEDDNTYSVMAKKYDLVNKLKDTPYWIQAEIVGPKIQKNLLKLSEHEIRVFNVYDCIQKKYLSFDDYVRVVGELDLPLAPIIEVGLNFNYTVDELRELAKGKYPGTDNHREGIVIRPTVEFRSAVLKDRMSFKKINDEYLCNGGN